MGSVFLARHVVMNRLCAIKILPSKYRDDPDLLNRFQTEARAIAALDHPNIVRPYDFNKDASSGSEMYYLVMEYVEGQDLQRMVAKEGALDYQRAADFIRQAAIRPGARRTRRASCIAISSPPISLWMAREL